MKNKFFVCAIALLFSGVMLSACTNSKPSDDAKADSFDKYEWGSYDISDNYKKRLLNYEEEDPFTYVKDDKIYAKCQNGDYVEGDTKSLKIYSKALNYLCYDCGQTKYSYHDYNNNRFKFYDDFSSAYGTNWDLSTFNKLDSVASFDEAISIIGVKIYSIYHLNENKFSDGLLCDYYYAYGPNFNSKFVISGFANDDNNVKTYCTALDSIKPKISKYKLWRQSGGVSLIDHTQEIDFEAVTTEEAKIVHDELIKLCGQENTEYTALISSDSYTDSATEFETKINYITSLFGIELADTIYVNYDNGKLNYKVSYPNFTYIEGKGTFGFNHLGFVKEISYSDNGGVYYVLKRNTNEAYIMANCTDAELKFAMPTYAEYDPFESIKVENVSNGDEFIYYTYLDSDIPFDLEHDRCFCIGAMNAANNDYNVEMTLELYDSNFNKIEVNLFEYEDSISLFYANKALSSGIYYFSIKINQDLYNNEFSFYMAYCLGE